MAVGLIYIGSGLATVVVGWLSDKAMTKEGALKGRRRYMLAACFILSSLIVAVPFVASTWIILVLFMLALTGIKGGFATTSALISDLVEDGNGLGKAVGLMGLGGQCFGLAAPIVTGYLLQMTGGFNSAIWFAGALLVTGAVLACSETRRPIASS